MALRLDKDVLNEHAKFNKFDKYKAKKADVMKVADISQADIDASKSRSYSVIDLETARDISQNPTLTQEELNELKKAAKEKRNIEPTGKFAK